jgi:flagellar basal body-associated protein FliL
MTKGTKIALVVGGLAIVGGGIAFAMMRKKPQVAGTRPQPQSQPEPEMVQTEETKKKKNKAIIPILGGLFVAGGTYYALKKKDKDKTGSESAVFDNDFSYGY